MRRCLLFLLSTLTIACSSSPTEACDLLVKPMLVGRILHVDHVTRVVTKVDSIYSNVAMLADTFRVCGTDTTKISVTRYKFRDE